MEKEKRRSGAAITLMSELRHRRKIRKIRQWTIIILVVVGVAAYLTGAWKQAFTTIGDLADSVRIALEPGMGWPAKTGIPKILQLEPLAGGFAELGERDLVLYSARGNRLRSIQHGYARPSISVGNHRLCLYNRAGTELRVESRTRTLNTKIFDRPILLAEMSPNGSVAVATGSKRGLAELTVLDPSMRFRYGMTLYEEDGMPQGIAYAPDNRRLAVACLTAHNGSLASNIFLLDTSSDDITAQIQVNGSPVLQMHWITEKKLLVIYKSMVSVYDAATGEELAVFSYSGQPLAAASVSGQTTALLFGQPMTDTPARLVVLDPNMQYLADIQVPATAFGVECTPTKVYVLRKTGVAAYTLAGEQLWEKPMETPPLAVLDAKQPLVFQGGMVQPLEPPEENESHSE